MRVRGLLLFVLVALAAGPALAKENRRKQNWVSVVLSPIRGTFGAVKFCVDKIGDGLKAILPKEKADKAEQVLEKFEAKVDSLEEKVEAAAEELVGAIADATEGAGGGEASAEEEDDAAEDEGSPAGGAAEAGEL